MSDGGFRSMAARGVAGDAPTLGVGMLGYAFMGKAHTHALKTIPHMLYPPLALPRLAAIAGRDEDGVAAAAARYGYARHTTDWRALLDSDVDVFDNVGPNHLHAEPTIAAARAGKHVICEKPLARTADEARAMLDAAQTAGVKHMVAFNYRFVPALALARDLIQRGVLGRLYHFRASYLQEWIMAADFPRVWRLDRSLAGSGALGDLGSHIVDLARYLVNEPTQVVALTRTFISDRPDEAGGRATVDVDDAFGALLSFENGAMGVLEASRFAAGRKNHQVIEVNGAKGSLRFNLERLNELEVYLNDDTPSDARGFRQVLVTEPEHPFMRHWWPQGHIIGWEHTFAHELAHFLACVAQDTLVDPVGASFVDGVKNAVILDAIVQAAQTGRTVDIAYGL